ncbi:DUF1150 family protein [Aquibium sp. A9E412]|uniref:BQ00720 family protein n=1 Tax=Aquibium sp. A9E412 TaxID=2976767 RepID=UPI0025AEFC11|nr:DUF1150 family protein [Aquibium sp. A9E412]MDN2566477.1 DUF1150 family protein [Aquibium sp. A9E412]
MTENETRITVSPDELAHIGEGVVAYMREIEAEELMGKFPNLPRIEPGTKLWALFAANGQPIMLADARSSALAGAMENDLTTVSVH